MSTSSAPLSVSEIISFEQSLPRTADQATPLLWPAPALLTRLMFFSMVIKNAPPGQGRARLLWPGALGRIHVLHLEHTYTVGRDPEVDLFLDNPQVSRTHCVIRHFTGHDEIEDLCSSNGTWVNGKRTTRKILRDGDVIEVGRQFLAYENPG